MPTKTADKQKGSVEFSPYLAARAEYDERYGTWMVRERNWRTAFVMMAILAFLMSIALIEEMRRSHVVPFVVAVDHLQHVVGEGVASESTITDPQVVHAQLRKYVENARGVTSDKFLLKERLESLFNMTADSSQASGFIVEYLKKKEDPFAASEAGTVQINVKNINQLTGTSYEVSWVEDRRDNRGTLIASQEWKGILTLQYKAAKTEEDEAKNPLGIYVTEISWSKTI